MDGYADMYDQLVDTDPMALRDMLYKRDAEIGRLKRQIVQEHGVKAWAVETASGVPAPCFCPICMEARE